MKAGEAAGHVHSWLEQPPVELLDPGTGHVEGVLKLLNDLGTAGNLVTDAQIAAAALDHDAVVHATDTDFLRFGGLRWFNPITGVSSTSQRRAKDHTRSQRP
jgi:predicted nucleic acid-binding protein